MDRRHIGPKFKIPAGSFLFTAYQKLCHLSRPSKSFKPCAICLVLIDRFLFTAYSNSKSFKPCAICLVLIDRFLFTAYQKLTRRSLTSLQRIGVGHILNILGMATSALVESKRLHAARSHNLVDMPNSIVPLSALWVAGPLAIVGIGEAFHFPVQVALYYEEFPKSLKSTATAMVAMLVAVGFYLSTALIDLTRRVAGWLPDNINKGRIDNVFWFLVVIGVINFGYYLICATLYKHQNVEKSSVDNNYMIKNKS